MALLTLEQQEEIWTLSRTCDVFEKDINGELWQVIDMTNGEEANNRLLIKGNPLSKGRLKAR